MKDILESSDAFTAHATISAGYFMLQQLQKQMDKENLLSPIEKMVDVATGADKDRLDRHKNNISACLIDIIEAKKVIEVDYANDLKLLMQLNGKV